MMNPNSIDMPAAPTWAGKVTTDDFEAPYFVFALPPDGAVKMIFRWIAPGVSLLGSEKHEIGRGPKEATQDWFTLERGFWLSNSPCTVSQWLSLCPFPDAHYKHSDGRYPRMPITGVSWRGAARWCIKLGTAITVPDAFRLPTIDEWEYSCRARTTGRFFLPARGHDDRRLMSAIGWCRSNCNGLQPVTMKRPNPWGLYDMHGGVWEWCSDEADWKQLWGVCDESRYVYRGSHIRPLKGGSFASDAHRCRSAAIAYRHMRTKSAMFGFRVLAEA